MKPPHTQENRPVGIWIRVSTDDQAQGDSPEHHEIRAREYAKLKGWTVREIYDLAGVSGKAVMEHPECKRMLADIKRGHITVLVFSKLARFSRNKWELEDFSKYFQKYHADLVSIEEQIDTSTPAGRMFYSIIAVMAHWEREEIGGRVQASVATRAKLGKPLNGSAPYGFKWEAKKLVQEPTEAAILRRAFELFAAHRRKGAVARHLNAAGYRTRQGAAWSDTAVARLLVQPAAKGLYLYNTTRKLGDWETEEKPESQWGRLSVPPVISEELWRQTERILEEQAKTFAKPGKPPVRLFGSMTWCHCGKKMYVPSGSRKYTCTTCKNKIPADDLEAIFCEEVRDYFATPQRVEERLGAARRELSGKEAAIAAHKAEIQKVRGDMARTHRLYLEGQIAFEAFGRYHEPLETRLKELQASLPEMEAELAYFGVRGVSADEVVRESRDLASRWPKMALEERRKIVESIAEKIVIGKGEIEINLSYLPSSEELTKSQQLL
jgi:site-specific DNA recombinase